MSATILNGEMRQGKSGYRLAGNRIETYETFHYIVVTDSVSVDRDQVKLAAGLPWVGISYTANGAYCTNIDAVRREGNPLYWDVTAEFSSDANDQVPGTTPSPDPTTWVPVFKIDYEYVDIVEAADQNGTPLLNSAKERFDEGIVTSRPVSVWRFSQYEDDTLTEKEVAQRSNVMNDDEFAGFERNTLVLQVVGSERTFVNGYPVRRIDFVLKYFEGQAAANAYKYFDSGTQTWTTATWPSGWQELRLDVGNYYIDSAKRKTYFTDDGHRIIGGLDGAGARVAYNVAPALLAFDKYKEADFEQIIRTA